MIAHEPPLESLLPDAAEVAVRTDDMIATYAAGDALGAWEKFLAIGNLDVPAEVMVAREPRQLADERRWFLHEMRGTVGFRPDVDALGAVDVVVGIGEESQGEICDRTSRALAGLLGVEPTLFPGGHIAFAEDPAAFVPRLREVLGGIR